LTDDDQSRSKSDPDKDALKGRLVGELKLELVNSSTSQTHRHETIKDQLKNLSFWVNILTFFAVAFYGYQAWDANWLTRKTLATTQRSHLGFTNVQITSYKPDQFRITFDLDNQGNSASTDVRVDFRMVDWDADKSCKILNVSKSVRFGDSWFQTGSEYHSSVPLDGFTNQEWTDVTVHKSFIKITGALTYNDGFAEVSEGGACFRYDGNWEVCPAADDASLKECKKDK
jgi:hypothetical protein